MSTESNSSSRRTSLLQQIGKPLVFLAVVVAIVVIFSPEAKNRFGSVKAPSARKPMPDFSLPTMAGEPWKLTENRGRVLLVNFWATWCPPCREETPALVELANTYRPHGFEVIGVNLDDDPKNAVPGFVKQYRISYPMLVPTADSALAGAISSLPTSLLVDKQGRVARTYIGAVTGRVLEGDIRKLLAE